MDQERFLLNEREIKEMLSRLSKAYLFEDLGYTLKNSYNWGCRESRVGDSGYDDKGDYNYDICILDYGYLYPLHDQGERLMRCPRCQHKLEWNVNYTGLACSSSGCGYQCTPMELRARMNRIYDDVENRIIMDKLTNLKMPNLSREGEIH